MDQPAPSSGEPLPAAPASSAPPPRDVLGWLPTYLAVLSIHGHGRALHVAKVNEGLVQVARVSYPAFNRACLRILDHRAL